MNPRLKEEWVKALRSGDYEQGTVRLCNDDDQFCCLGVLADIAIDSFWLPRWGGWMLDEGDRALTLGTDIEKKLRLHGKDIGHLIEMNDGGSSFETIANWIEENL